MAEPAVNGYQAQHILPDNLLGAFGERISRWTSGDFNVNAGYNLIHLPNNSDWGAQTGFVRHLGSHPEYDNFIRRTLSSIDALPIIDAQKGEMFTGFMAYLREGQQLNGPLGVRALFLNAQDLNSGFNGDSNAVRTYYQQNHSFNDVLNSEAYQRGIIGQSTNGSYRGISADTHVYGSGTAASATSNFNRLSGDINNIGNGVVCPCPLKLFHLLVSNFDGKGDGYTPSGRLRAGKEEIF